MKEGKQSNPFSRFLQAYTRTDDAAEETMPDTSTDGHLVLDMYEKDNAYHITAPTAGVHPDDVEIELNDEYIIIKGERHHRKHEEGKNYHMQECYWGSFSRQVNFPTAIDAEDATATFKDGMLHISIPKAKSAQTRTLKIKTM